MTGRDIELTGPIVFKSADEEMVATAAVLVPGEADSDGEILDEETIRKAAWGWMEKYRNIDIQHSLVSVAVPVESYILPMDMDVTMAGKTAVLPRGSWILSAKITDPAIWARIKSGDLSGFSVMGVSQDTLKEIAAGRGTR